MENASYAMDATVLAAQIILESSGETYRAEETVLRMGKGFQFTETEILAFPTGFTISFTLPDGRVESRVLRIRNRSICLGDIDRVNAISRKAATGEMCAEDALQELRALRLIPQMTPLQSSIVYGLSAAFFSLMFDGHLKEFVMSFVCGALLQSAKPYLLKRHTPSPVIALFLSSIAALTALVLIRIAGGNQEAVITGAIMPLLPGLAMTNAVRDAMRGDLISGMARGMDALLSAIMLAIGVALVMLLWGVI